jgi:hypothetical protein
LGIFLIAAIDAMKCTPFDWLVQISFD